MNTPLQLTSDKALIILNGCLEDAVKAYLPEGVKTCFDLPDSDTPPSSPTVSLFLYGIQEDLELRTGIVRHFKNSTMAPGLVNIKCDYLITYWEPDDKSPCEGPKAKSDSPAMTTMNRVLNALINNRELSGMPGSYTRVITPQELGNLSHFWQALGNKPRLCLNYTATIPVQLRDPNETYAPVEKDKLQLELKLKKIEPEENQATINTVALPSSQSSQTRPATGLSL